jgi:hypothetical protein
MSNWYCIPSGCAEVVYQEYEPPKIRWRYGSEPWQEIIGADDYSLTQIESSCPGQPHELNYGRQNVVFSGESCSPTNVTVFTPVRNWQGHTNAPFSNLRISAPSQGFEIIYPDPLTAPPLTKYWCSDQNFRTYFYVTDNTGTEKLLVSTAARGFAFINFGVRPDFVQNCPPSQCEFKVFKNGQIVHQETRAICPEVEKLPCRLSDLVKTIEIKKLPYLERVEVVPYQYSTYRLPGVPAPIVQADPIPSQCLNIYNNAIYVVPPSGQGIYPDAIPFDSFVAQICSASGCLPPEYQVICDCNNCESCPGDTCPIECDGRICCYNDYGVSIKEIPLSNYCGGNS